jgi:hypothetical protein
MARSREALQGALKLCGRLLIVSGVLHLIAWIIGALGGDSARMLPFGIAYLLVGAGLFYRLPVVRYLALIVTLVGVLGAYITLGGAGVVAWLSGLFITIDLVVILLLAASIWRGRRPA